MELIGLDIGTTNWKASLFDTDGNVLSSAKTPAITHKDKYGDYYIPEELYYNVCKLIKQTILQTKDKNSIKAISIASMGEAGLLIDEYGEALYPIITWYDKRTEKQSIWLKENIGQKNIGKITGLNITHIYGLCKLMWLRENKPKIFKRAYKWLCIPDYIIFRLTGEYITDYSIATRTMLFDIHKREWSDEILKLTSMSQKLLPNVIQSGSIAGKITDRANKETGLAKNTYVVTGGHDHICGAFAVGATKPGVMLDSIGTAESIFTTVDNKVIEKMAQNDFSVGCHVIKDKYYVIGGIYSSAASIEWFKENFLNKGSYDFLVNLARKSNAGSNGLFFMPHLRGSGPPHRDLNSKGAFIGITTEHKMHHFINALLEGLGFESRSTIESMESLFNIKTKKIKVIGGPTKNEYFMKVKADIINRKLEVIRNVEAATLGAALLAGIGAKIYKNEDDALKNTNRKVIDILPNKGPAMKYDKLYKEIYVKLYKAIAELNHRIDNLKLR